MAAGGAGNKFVYLLYLAVFVLFIHAIIQQSIIANIRAEIQAVLGNFHTTKVISKGLIESKLNTTSGKSGGEATTGSFEFYRVTKSPPNMPSVRLSDEQEVIASKVRDIYGGKKVKYTYLV